MKNIYHGANIKLTWATKVSRNNKKCFMRGKYEKKIFGSKYKIKMFIKNKKKIFQPLSKSYCFKCQKNENIIISMNKFI